MNKNKTTKQIMLFLSLLVLMPTIANAAPWDTAGAQVLAIFSSGMAHTIATIAILACGIAAIAGKLSWEWAIKIVLGIVLITGAPTIATYFGA